MSELATNTSTADTTIGSHSPMSVSTATSLWIGDGPILGVTGPGGQENPRSAWDFLNPVTPAVRLSG